MSDQERLGGYDSLQDLYTGASHLHNGLWRLVQDRCNRQLGCPIDIKDLTVYADACRNGTGKLPDDKQALSAISGALAMSLGIAARIANANINLWREKPDEADSLTALFIQIKRAEGYCLAVNRDFPELVLEVFPRVDSSLRNYPERSGERVKERIDRQMGLNFVLAMLSISLASTRHGHW